MRQNTYVKLVLSYLKHLLFVLGFLISTTGNLHASKIEKLKSLNSDNHFAIMRHSFAPGMGDPPNFDLGDCSTQRNLSQQGITQAESIAKKFRDNGILKARVFTSQWCRCIDTANYLDLGTATELPIINSFFQTQTQGAVQTQSLIMWLAKQDLTTPLVLVTHQVNITQLTDIYPASGEIIIIKRDPSGTLTVMDRVQTN